MIKIELDMQNDVNNIRMSGEPEDIAAELATSVLIIHDGIRRRSEDDADSFLAMLVLYLLDHENHISLVVDGEVSDE